MALKLRIITPGKHDLSVSSLLSEYEKRISRFATLEWVLVPSGNQGSEITALKKVLGNSSYIVLDETGTSITTEQISQKIENLANQGQSVVTLVIGGAYGLDDELRAKAATVWAFGAITLPHQLVRVIAAEQLYRAMTILNNHPYHHS